jgi:hypothetical protein
MFVRLSWFKGSADKIDEGLKVVERALPTIQAYRGYAGAVLCANRETGESMTAVYYQDEPSLKANAENAAKVRRQASEQLGLQALGIDELEVVIVDRAQPPAANVWTRLITGSVPVDRAAEATAVVRDKGLPMLKRQEGYRGYIAGVNRQTGRAVTAAIYDTRAHVDAGNVAMAAFRDQLQNSGLLRDMDLKIFEILLSDIPAPITAGV